MAIYFTDKEMACSCCGTISESGIDTNLYAVLDQIRVIIGKPLYVNSGYRCPKHNEEVGGVPNSQHVLGTAVDIAAPEGVSVDELADTAERVLSFFGIGGGVGRYWSLGFVHIDTRTDGPARWDENNV